MKPTQNNRAQRDWRSRLTQDEREALALLEWQIGVYDVGREHLAHLREKIVKRASKRAPKVGAKALDNVQ